MSLLERRYRRTLRMLPGWYRERWEDEMVAAFMEGSFSTDPDTDVVGVGRPRLAEVLSVAALALRLRLGGDGSPPRAHVWREAWRRVALLNLLYSGAFAVIVGALRLALLLDGRLLGPDGGSANLAQSWLNLAAPVFDLLWLVAFVLLVFGRLRAARDFAVSAGILSVGGLVASTVVSDYPSWTYSMFPVLLWTLTPAFVLVMLSIAAPRVEPPLSGRARGAWFGGFGLFLVASAGTTAAMMRRPDGIEWDLVSTLCAVLVLATFGVLAAGVASRRPAVAWLLALAVVGAGLADLRWFTLGAVLDGTGRSSTIGTAVAILTLATAGLAGVAGLRALRRESPTPTGPLRVGG